MAKFALKTALPGYLRDEQQRIEEHARAYGLDFFPTLFEVLRLPVEQPWLAAQPRPPALAEDRR